MIFDSEGESRVSSGVFFVESGIVMSCFEKRVEFIVLCRQFVEYSEDVVSGLQMKLLLFIVNGYFYIEDVFNCGGIYLVFGSD